MAAQKIEVTVLTSYYDESLKKTVLRGNTLEVTPDRAKVLSAKGLVRISGKQEALSGQKG